MQRTSLIFWGDFLSFWLSFALVILVRYGGAGLVPAVEKHLLPFIILYVAWALVFYLFGLYDLFKIKPTIPHFRVFGLATLASFGIGVIFFYFLPVFGIAPKTNLLYQVAGFSILSFFFRRLVYTLYSSQIVKPVILVGETKYLEELKTTIESNPQIGLKIIFTTPHFTEAIQKYPHINNAVLILESTSQKIEDKEMVSLLGRRIEIMDVAHAYEKYLFKIPVGYISQGWVIENINTKTDILYNVLTRVMDVTLSMIVLLVLSPFLAMVALIIYLSDKGKVFYSQERIGQNERIFTLYKFRTMYDSLKMNPDANGDSPRWQEVNDSRITPFGNILRKLHIDEIPQMFNVLLGDITLVGPRPERPEFVRSLRDRIPNYGLRHIIKPGFTGWAQIKFRYARTEEDSKEKFEYDLYYIKNRNIFMNLGILLRTIQIIFTH